jgi:hypothetical protein
MVMTSGTYTPRQHPRHDRDVVEAGGADLHPERAEVALGHHVVAHLAERVLGGHPGLALGHLDDAGHLGHDRARRQAVEELVDDLGGLAGLLEADPEAGEAVAVGVGPDLPVDLVVGQGTGWSRRRSQSTPLARRLAPDRPYCRATSAGMTPMPRVRAWKISLPSSRSPSRRRSRGSSPSPALVSAIQPLGRSSLRPPMRSKLGWKRPPVAASIWLSTYSRSRKA